MAQQNFDKRKQEMQKRREAEEIRRKQEQLKRKKRLFIMAIALVLIVAITCAIAIPVILKTRNKYKELSFDNLVVPNNEEAAKKFIYLNKQNVVIEGYACPCTSYYSCICKTTVNTCPYVNGVIPTDSMMVQYKDLRPLTLALNSKVRVWGTMVVNTIKPFVFEGQNTYMYLLVDKFEILS